MAEARREARGTRSAGKSAVKKADFGRCGAAGSVWTVRSTVSVRGGRLGGGSNPSAGGSEAAGAAAEEAAAGGGAGLEPAAEWAAE